MKNFLKFFFLIITYKIKIRFNLPKEKELVVFDNTSFHDLENILKKRDYFVLKVRINQIDEIFFNIKIIKNIFRNLQKYKSKKIKTKNILWSSYLISLISLLKPKLVISHIDNSKKFSEISLILNKNIKFITIQNAARYDLIIEKENSNKVNELYIQNFCCFGDYEIELYKLLNIKVDNFIKIGSIRKSNFFDYVKKKKILLDKNLYNVGIILEAPLAVPNVKNNTDHFAMTLKYSIRYSIEKNLKPIFIGKFENVKKHLDFFKDYLDKSETEIIEKNFIIRDNAIFSSYMACFQSEILIGVASTLLREKISSGEKILCCNFSGSDIWDFPIQGLCFTKENKYELFKNRVDQIRKISSSEYLSSLNKKCDYVLCDESDKTSLQKLNNLMDKALNIA